MKDVLHARCRPRAAAREPHSRRSQRQRAGRRLRGALSGPPRPPAGPARARPRLWRRRLRGPVPVTRAARAVDRRRHRALGRGGGAHPHRRRLRHLRRRAPAVRRRQLRPRLLQAGAGARAPPAAAARRGGARADPRRVAGRVHVPPRGVPLAQLLELHAVRADGAGRRGRSRAGGGAARDRRVHAGRLASASARRASSTAGGRGSRRPTGPSRCSRDRRAGTTAPSTRRSSC